MTWTPTPEDSLNSIEYLLGLAPDNVSGLIEASDLRAIIQHFGSVQHHLTDKLVAADTKIADLEAQLAAHHFQAGHGVATFSDDTVSNRGDVPPNVTITFPLPFQIVPFVTVSPSREWEHGHQRRTVFTVIRKTLVDFHVVGTYYGDPELEGFTGVAASTQKITGDVEFDWIAVDARAAHGAA